jgi:hypothetical protein
MLKSNNIWLGAAALVLTHFAYAQSMNPSAASAQPSVSASSAAPAVTANAVPTQTGQPSEDPIIQRRLAKKRAKAEYKAQKKAAKQEYKEEKQEANANLKAMRQTQGLQPSSDVISSGR